MKALLLAVLLTLSFISVATSQGQGKLENQVHYLALYAGLDFNIASIGIQQAGSLVQISPPLEFRLWILRIGAMQWLQRNIWS